MPKKIFLSIQITLLLSYLLIFPHESFAKACASTNWQVDIRSAGRDANTVTVNQPYTVTITIPSADYSASFKQFGANIWFRYPLQTPWHTDNDTIIGSGAIGRSVPAPTKNASGPTVIKIEFDHPTNFLKKEGKAFVEINYSPKSPTDNGWGRKCDTSNNYFTISEPTLPECSIEGVNSCMAEKTTFNPKINILNPNFNYYYFLTKTPPPRINSTLGIEGLFTGSNVIPALFDGDIKYKVVSIAPADHLFSDKINSTTTLTRYQQIFDNLQVNTSQQYSLTVVGVSKTARSVYTGFGGVEMTVCAVGTFIKTADTSLDACKKPNISTAKSQINVCIAGKDCTTAGGELCDNDKGVATAIGCVHTDPTLLVKDIFKLATGIGGGIAFLLMVFGAFQMITSAGNPETLKAGQERFKDAIIGILFIVFSVLLLRIIGVDILGFGQFLGV